MNNTPQETITQDRADFEAKFSNYCLSKYNETGDYVVSETAGAWEGWQACAQLTREREASEASQSEPVAINTEYLKTAITDFRDVVLNQRGALAENGMTNDHVNDVLSEFDYYFDDIKFSIPPAAPQQAIPSGWISVKDRLPEVRKGQAKEFIVGVYRKRNDKTYTFAAHYLNEMDLDDDGNGEQLRWTGWHHQFKHDNYDEYYEPLHFAEGDLLTHWMPLPAAPTAPIESDK